MSEDGKTIYRVYLEGLNTTERTIFTGLIRLAERQGTHYQVESVPEKTDIFILDGLDQRCLELGQSHLQIAQRAIWVDPPAYLMPFQQIRRPLQWSVLLRLMERIIGRIREPVAEAVVHRVIELTFEQLCGISEGVLRLHLGIAAEFVVDDVRDAMRRRGGANGVVIEPDVFLATLRGQLPGNVDAQKVIDELSAAISHAQHGS